YYKFFENSLVPDESFFHTLIMNSEYRTEVVNNNFVYLKWGKTISSRNSPQNLTREDIKLIEESEYYFARKFDENVDNIVVDYFANKVRFGVMEKAKKEEEFSYV
ncbi:beta-1,6-N-acetylglucosaminyltransferase, partial [Neobacillus niacini]|uniref:beta-1,6-N-acetylglucosaminyltransferase n=1 Tax=Neobacillus niacini TaxID=86668 RepID=UPI002FFF2208